MIVLNLELDNILGFENFKINFSYPKKIVNSTIKNETLSEKPNFRYKKINILIGTNASGKTSIGKALMGIFNFFQKKESSYILKIINKGIKEAYFSIDFVLKGEILYRINCHIKTIEKENALEKKEAKKNEVNIGLEVFKSKILKNDSYEMALKKLEKISLDNESYLEALEHLEDSLGWLFTFPEIDSNSLGRIINETDLKILENIIKTLDPSVKRITKLKDKDIKNAYKLEIKNQNLIIQNGNIIDNSLLSSGTKAGLDIASFVASIKKNSNGFYYCDEKFSYIHSDIEKAILSLMIDLLKPNTQLFFTTHNLDVATLDLPLHSFTFLRKKEKIEVLYPADFMKKNDSSLRNAIKNDNFEMTPNLDLIYDIEDM